MVLKVVADFSNFPSIMPKIEKYNYTFLNNSLYISDVSTISSKKFYKFINSLFGNNCFSIEINMDNLNSELPNAQDWCHKQIVWATLIKFENEEQDKLQNTMKLLDQIESKIDQYIKERGDSDGRSKEGTKETGKTSKET